MDELVRRGKRVRMVNRGGWANLPEGVEVVGGDATDPAFTRDDNFDDNRADLRRDVAARTHCLLPTKHLQTRHFAGCGDTRRKTPVTYLKSVQCGFESHLICYRKLPIYGEGSSHISFL